jgi:hypothetical protein
LVGLRHSDEDLDVARAERDGDAGLAGGVLMVNQL